jgi:DNA modification methylase
MKGLIQARLDEFLLTAHSLSTLKRSESKVNGMGPFEYHLEDARNLEKVIRPHQVDVTITSPPYWRRKRYTKLKTEIGRESTLEEYLSNLKEILTQCYRVTKDTGSLWLVVDGFREGDKYRPLPFYILQKAEESGWILRDIIVWDKVKTRPWSSNGKTHYLRRIFEYILFFTKGSNFKFYLDRIREPDPVQLKPWWVDYPERYNPKGQVPTNLWRFVIPTQGSWGGRFLRHFCPFPPELVRRILLLTTDEGDVVLDPFAGSGVVLAVAELMKRKAIGFDIQPSYVRAYPRVRDGIAKQWRERRSQDIAKIFKETLMQLKFIKFAKITGKKSDLNHYGILAIYNPETSSGEIVLIVPDTVPAADKEEQLKSLQNALGSTVSAFGISPKIDICDMTQISKYKLPRTLFIYNEKNIRGPVYSLKSKQRLFDFLFREHESHWIISNVNTEQGLSTIMRFVQERSPNSPLLNLAVPKPERLDKESEKSLWSSVLHHLQHPWEVKDHIREKLKTLKTRPTSLTP